MNFRRRAFPSAVLLAASCLVPASRLRSHPGPHPPPRAPAPVVAPALSPGAFGKGDPLINGFQSDLGITTGGIAYEWTVSAVGTFSAHLAGIVGASSWSDPEQLSVGEGRTRAASWVALNLRFPSRVGIRLSRAPGVTDPLAPLPDGTGGDTLRPAFTLYSGWHENGSDEAGFANQGAISWAPVLVYRAHQTGGEEGTASASYELPAGRYTLVFGGLGEEGGFDRGRQGYEADLDILSRAAPASLVAAPKARTKRSVHTLRGRFRHPASAAYLAVQFKGRTRFLPARGPRWSVRIPGLRRGPNYVYVTAVSWDGRLSPRKRILIHRR